MPPLPLAHETWLREDQVPTDWDFVFEGATLALLAAAVLVTVAGAVTAPSGAPASHRALGFPATMSSIGSLVHPDMRPRPGIAPDGSAQRAEDKGPRCSN